MNDYRRWRGHDEGHVVTIRCFVVSLLIVGTASAMAGEVRHEGGPSSEGIEPVAGSTVERVLPAASDLHPETEDPTQHELTPADLVVPPGWTGEVWSTHPVWTAMASGPGVQRGEVGLTLKADPSGWNVYDKVWLALDVTNKGSSDVLVRGGLRHPLGPIGAETIEPGETRTLAVLIIRELKEEHAHLADAMRGIAGLPGGQFNFWRKVDASAVTDLKLHVSSIAPQIALELSTLRGVIDYSPPSEDQFDSNLTPLIDRFGQNRHDRWPGKVSSVSELREDISREEADIKAFPRPDSWNRFGGWKDGPQVEATGHFRTQKVQDRWWLVDPEGRLFWSFGINCVIAEDRHGIGRTTTPGVWRELSAIPEDEPKPGDLPGIGAEERWHPYTANLFRKYGEDWKTHSVDLAHRRLASWGVNTLGNWSGTEVVSAGRTPYVKDVHFKRPALQYGRTYYQASLPDIFDPGFTESLRARMTDIAATTAEDPWCIGYFIDNELPFRNIRQIGTSILTASAERSAKQAFVKWLQDRYPSLDALKDAWGTAFADWESVADLTEWREGEVLASDADAFARIYLDEYFRICKTIVNEVAPDKLYLGSRFHHYFPEVFEACSRHADVVSINYYDYSPVALPLMRTFEGDKPFIIGEFHFGTITEQGGWGPGLAQAKDLEHSARLLHRYIRDCLADPRIVGAHWFQYMDQPLTGRGDGENFRVGFVNITDQPHPALIQASRTIGREMYNLRMGRELVGQR